MPDDLQAINSLRAKLKGTNINEQTLLATDYLNHLNEPIMLFEMVADVPELLEELAAWEPKSYVDHFADSTFTDKDLAIEAYAIAPAIYKDAFDETIDDARRCIETAIEALSTLCEQERVDEVRLVATEVSEILGSLIGKASSIINGQVERVDQTEIDKIMDS